MPVSQRTTWRVKLSTCVICFYHIHSYSSEPEESSGVMNNHGCHNVGHDLYWPTMLFISRESARLMSETQEMVWNGGVDVLLALPQLEWDCDKDTHTLSLFIALSLSLSLLHTHTHTKPVLLSSVAGCRGVKCRWTVIGHRWRPWCHPVCPHKD